MYLDTDNFDFFNLADITDDEKAHAPKPQSPVISSGSTSESVGADGGLVEDTSDLDSYFAEEAEEKAAEDEANPNLNLSDLADPNAAQEAVNIWEDLADDVPISINGKSFTKAQLAETAEKAEKVAAESEMLSDAAKRVDDISRYIAQKFHENKTAIDLNIERLQRQLDNASSDVEYGNYARNLQSAQEARKALSNQVDELMRLHDVQRMDLANFRANQELQINSQKIPGWENKRNVVIKHHAEKGIDFNALQHVWTPELAEALHDAFIYRKGREKAQASAMERAKAKAPRSTASTANAQRTNAQDAAAAKRAALVQKANRGDLSERETSDMFNYLID